MSSGTASLHLALKIIGVETGDTILCPSLTFAASANVILYENAIPVFVDVNSEHWTLDIDILEKAIKQFNPKALIAVDIYGQSCDYDELSFLCKKYNLFLIEDAAEALGSTYKKRKCGSFGDIGVISFNGNKIITTSGGGLLTSQNDDYIKKAKFLASQAREDTLHYQHNEIGYNYRMSNILASIAHTIIITNLIMLIM